MGRIVSPPQISFAKICGYPGTTECDLAVICLVQMRSSWGRVGWAPPTPSPASSWKEEIWTQDIHVGRTPREEEAREPQAKNSEDGQQSTRS